MQASITRRGLLALSALAAAARALPAFAQPKSTVKLVVPFPAGGTADILPRILAEKVHTSYPAGIIVENRAGAGGNIGAEYVARSDPDGLTFLVSPPGPIAINQNLYKKLSFDPSKWVPITVIATVPNVLDVRKDFPAKNLAEFIAYVKANPGKVTYASQGNGSTSHLTAHLFMQLTGTEMIHVPYKGTAPALVDIVGGQVDVFFDNLSSSFPYHKSGKLRILAVADQKRSPQLPDVPTFVENKLPGMVAVTFFTMVAPPGTSQAIVDVTYKNFAGALAQADTRGKFAAQGATPAGWTPQQTARFIQDETAKWAKVIKTANVTVE
ncbi:tripartite tricarboxylate transporter substrate binding protein [Ramlibacter sp. G-1-2-2]|uniref:Tripartite tricarboxylate transporter substrate binding protein n=1 Tax=Ramlibacter agri TaxID=2728837 RepID=A0A848H3I9_9BURK|nr:tripartite tricarboxylate transporter substrate binding protein [Ramlibacter agri]NML45365.1 tripartite tricarboxylate transporter substrate binding protein [Ramlibacter agri]